MPVRNSFLLKTCLLALMLILLAACRGPAAAPTSDNPPAAETAAVKTSPGAATTAPTAGLPEMPSATQPVPTAPFLAEPPPPVAPEQPIPGVEVEGISDAAAMELVAGSGVQWTRVNALQWSQIQPQWSAPDWAPAAALEAQLSAAAAKGLRAILVVRSTPGWAQKVPGSACGPIDEENLDDFAAFVQEAVLRYSAAPFHVKYWELGNEPDVDVAAVPGESPFGCWGDPADPYYGGGYYAQMLSHVYPAIKAADPEAQVLVGGLLLDCDPVNPPVGKNCQPARFMEGILATGGGDFFDGVSFHAYDYFAGPYQYSNLNWHAAWNSTGPVHVPKTMYLRSLLKAYGYPEKYLMNTEAGLICGSTGAEPECKTRDYEFSKAAYLAQSNALALADGLYSNVWYSLWGWRGTAMAESANRLLPIYAAQQISAAALRNVRSAVRLEGLSGVRGVEIIQDGRTIWIVWSADGLPHNLPLPSRPAGAYDVFGAALEPSPEMQVGQIPLYLDWPR